MKTFRHRRSPATLLHIFRSTLLKNIAGGRLLDCEATGYEISVYNVTKLIINIIIYLLTANRNI